MRENTTGAQKTFSKCGFTLPYRNDLDSGIIANEVTESRGVGRSDGVPTATPAVRLFCRSLQWGSRTAPPRCRMTWVKYSFSCLVVNQ